MPRRKMQPYQCPRCGYTIDRKSSMIYHFTVLKKPCPAVENDIELTDQIKEHVLANRIYKVPKQKDPKTTIINNYNQINNINNIIASMDVIDKLKHYMNFKGQSLIDFESTVEQKYKRTADQLDSDIFKHNYLLKPDQILGMVEKAAQPIHTLPDPVASHNVVYDKKHKELKIFDDGEWESMSLEAGTKHYIERIQRNFLDSYERYLLRKIDSLSPGIDRMAFTEMLQSYYQFIGCFELDPFCQDATDDQILRPVSSSEDEDDDDSIRNESDYDSNDSMRLSEEYYPFYKKVLKSLSKHEKTKMIRNVQDMLKRNSNKNVSDLNKKITKLFHMEETFRDILLSIQHPV